MNLGKLQSSVLAHDERRQSDQLPGEVCSMHSGAPALLTYESAARSINVKSSLLRRAAARRELRIQKFVHRTVRIRPVDLERWLNSKRVEASC